MVVKRLFKPLIKCFFVLLLLVLLCFIALTVWVLTGPRSLNSLTPTIESALAPAGSDYKVKIESSQLIWDGITHPIGIHAKNVDILDNKGATIAHFPEVGVRMYFFQLLIGRVNLKSIELLGPVAKLVEDEKGNITSFGFSNDNSGSNASIGAALALFTSEEGDNPITHLRSFIIRRASLSVMDSSGKTFLSSPSASLEITREHGAASGRLIMPLEFDGKRSEIDSRFSIDGNHKTVTSNLVFSDVPSNVLHAFAPTQKWMDAVRMPLSGWANMSSDFDANIDSIDFSVEAGQGIVDFPDQFEQPLKVQRVKLAGKLSDHLNSFEVKESEFDFEGHRLTFTGTGLRQGDDYGVDGFAETQNIAIEDVHRYWPLKLAPHSRRWVVTRLSKGKVVKAGVTLHFKPGDFKIKDTPDADIDATIIVKGVTVTYKPTHPPITDVDGEVRFTGRTMDAKIASAHYLNDTHVTSARVRFPDFYPDDVRLVMDMQLDTSGGDVQSFLALPDLNKAAKIGLTPDVTGQANGTAKLDFIAFSENDKDDVAATGKLNYSITANLVNVAQKAFMGNRDIADANMKLSVDNKGIKLSGKAKVNTLPMSIDLASSFAKDNETKYVIKTDMPVARLPDFDLPKLDFAKGVMGVNATFSSSDKAEKAEVELDLAHTELNLPQHGFIKKNGDKATLKFTTEKLPSGNTLVSSFTLDDGGDLSQGKAEFDKAAQDFTRFSFAPLKLGQQDLDTLDYQKNGKTITLSAKGRTFDASLYLKQTSGRDNSIGYAIDLHVDRVVLGEGRELSGVLVEADCPPDACRNARINAKLRDGTPFTYVISGGRLQATCDNAGELARTLGIFDTISGGKLRLNGQYDGGKLEGELDVTDYTIKRAPVLTKIFTIASLTGILDTLSGNGIYFSKLTAPYVYHNGIIILKDAKSHGSALGLTADGMVDLNKSTLDIKGVLVPSYTLNSLVGNIPWLGDIITGGGGKGLVALSYGIHGDIKDPSVHVNPLSVLTPGFLRDIFNIFDKPAPDMDTIDAAKKKAQTVTPPTASAPVTPPPATAAPVTPVTVTPVPAPAPPAPATDYPAPKVSDAPLPSLDELKK